MTAHPTDVLVAPRTRVTPPAPTYRVVLQAWEESRSGWGVWEDGCSLHLSDEDRERFIARYWKGMPDQPPEEYSRPAGGPREVCVGKALWQQIAGTKCGLRLWDVPAELTADAA